MTDIESRLCRLEQRLAAIDPLIASSQIALAQLQQFARTVQPGGYGGGGGGGGSGFLGVATANMAARSGATAPAAQDVTVMKDVSGTLTSTGSTVSARCGSSRTTALGNGIDSGGYCWVEPDAFGDFWASPLDCT